MGVVIRGVLEKMIIDNGSVTEMFNFIKNAPQMALTTLNLKSGSMYFLTLNHCIHVFQTVDHFSQHWCEYEEVTIQTNVTVDGSNMTSLQNVTEISPVGECKSCMIIVCTIYRLFCFFRNIIYLTKI